ncbi:Uncharacterized protein APZ42_016236 [Daphnia magna]|uniref:Uncharacterized protein n=1 Tax=Daphnia magna TaxID=35525 RepID=A0A165AJ15_9CRUS|nr:Uncharacterized protein APZ42_016236 [Daphnia magna]
MPERKERIFFLYIKNHFQQSLEKLLSDSETSETPELNYHDFTGSTNSISISPTSSTTFQTEQEPLSPIFSSVFNAEVAESASSGVLQTAQHLDPETATTGSEIMIGKIPDVVNLNLLIAECWLREMMNNYLNAN